MSTAFVSPPKPRHLKLAAVIKTKRSYIQNLVYPSDLLFLSDLQVSCFWNKWHQDSNNITPY